MPRVEGAGSDCQLCGGSGPVGLFGHGVMVFPNRIGINLFSVILYLGEFTVASPQILLGWPFSNALRT